MKIAAGMKVWLNSGSPVLDVLKVGSDWVTATWLNEDGNVQTMTTKDACLSLHECPVQA